MSSCRCCLKPHPLSLIERFNLSIQTIKFIRRNCSIFENILLDEFENFERIKSNFNKYFMLYSIKSNHILSLMSIKLNNRLENSIKLLDQFESMTSKCSIWLKRHAIKSNHSQLKYYRKQFEFFNRSIEQQNLLNDFSIYQKNYQQLCLQMDTIEREHMKLFFESNHLFSLVISLEHNDKTSSIINFDQIINEWKNKNKIHLTWLPDEHQQNDQSHLLALEYHVEQTSSDIEIRTIDNDDCSNSNQDKYPIKSNLSWSFTIVEKQEDPSISSSNHQSITHRAKSPSMNRVRLAIEAIERNSPHLLRERNS